MLKCALIITFPSFLATTRTRRIYIRHDECIQGYERSAHFPIDISCVPGLFCRRLWLHQIFGRRHRYHDRLFILRTSLGRSNLCRRPLCTTSGYWQCRRSGRSWRQPRRRSLLDHFPLLSGQTRFHYNGRHCGGVGPALAIHCHSRPKRNILQLR